MNHDIAHCNKADCPKKDSCYRYQAHLEAQEIGLSYLTYLIQDGCLSSEDGSCTKYWERKPRRYDNQD